jgi:hypothetical protein
MEREFAIFLALGSMLLLMPGAVSAHGREGKDRERMDRLLQSLFEMKAGANARRAGATLSSSAPTVRLPDTELSAIPSPPAVDSAWLLRARPQSQDEPTFSGLLRVSGASAMRNPATPRRSNLIRGSDSAGGEPTTAATRGAPIIKNIIPAYDDGDASTVRQHDFVRDLRRQFQQQAAQQAY